MGEILDPILLTIAGPNGSGKTTITQKLLQHPWSAGCRYINPDQIAKEQFGDWNSNDAMLKAAQEATRQREENLNSHVNFAFETVMSTEDKLLFLKKARDLGYFIRLFFIGTNDPSININRVAKRYASGGHCVPTEKIISRYFKSIAICAQAVPHVQRAYIYDNSQDIETMAPGKEYMPLVFRASDGVVVKAYETPYPGWTYPILRELQFAPGVPMPDGMPETPVTKPTTPSEMSF